MVSTVPFSFIVIVVWLKIGTALIQLEPPNNKLFVNDHHPSDKALIPKVTLTQKGYIQFLKYVVDVPEITDFTFCIWLKSFNLTHNHPLLSYSMHEHDRLIRVWITPQGTHINLELLEVPVFSVPVYLKEHKWYHICQSWSSKYGAWSLYMDGKLKARGNKPQLKQLIIPAHGDIVVGQEYTDFDKGLDDGIEGSISGFNLVLSPAFHYSSDSYANNILLEVNHSPVNSRKVWNRKLSDYSYTNLRKSMGLLLVELGYDCRYLRGAPLTGKNVLVSWTKTEVRVFGGAILKTVSPFCPKV